MVALYVHGGPLGRTFNVLEDVFLWGWAGANEGARDHREVQQPSHTKAQSYEHAQKGDHMMRAARAGVEAWLPARSVMVSCGHSW